MWGTVSNEKPGCCCQDKFLQNCQLSCENFLDLPVSPQIFFCVQSFYFLFLHRKWRVLNAAYFRERTSLPLTGTKVLSLKSQIWTFCMDWWTKYMQPNACKQKREPHCWNDRTHARTHASTRARTVMRWHVSKPKPPSSYKSTALHI